MTEISKKEFLTFVSKSRVIELEQLKKWLKTVDAKETTDLASQMVRDELLTQWQAKYLLTGRTRLDIGSYRLLERTQRDELGDRFLAIHKQLGRKVDIQVLPADLTKDKNRCEAFIQKASQTAKLDHPNLSHVYDIDQEGGRYFLVTEHLKGTSLDQKPRASLSLLDLAKIVDQSIAGLTFAHENNVIHGDLNQQDLVITDDNTVKIKNLAVSPIRTAANGSSAPRDSQFDFNALGKIGVDVLAEISPDGENDPDGLETVMKSLMSDNADTQAAARHELANWLAAHDYESSEETSDNLKYDADEEESEDPFGQRTVGGGFDEAIESGLAQRSRPKLTRTPVTVASSNDKFDDEEDFEDDAAPGFIKRLAQENPVGLIALASVLGLMLIGVIGYGAYHLLLKPTGQPAGSGTIAQIDSVKNHQPNEANKNNATGDVATPGSTDLKSQLSLSDPESVKKFMAELDPAKPLADKNNKRPETAKTEPQKTEPQKTEPPKFEPQKTEPAKTETPKTEPPKTEPAKTETPKTEPPKTIDSFKTFVKTIALPPFDDLKEKKVGDLAIDNRYLLGAELMMPAGASKAKLLFEMERDSSDNQKWIVTIRRNERTKKEPIAAFRKSESAVFFQWLPDAIKNRNTGYLQNCLIKFFIPDQSAWLKLREPVLLEPLILTDEELSPSLEVDLSYLPDESILRIEILPTKIPETKLSPGEIDLVARLPGRILLHEDDEEPFVWLQVNVELGRRLKARSELVLFALGNVQPIRNLAMLNEVALTCKQQENSFFAQYEAAKAAKAEKGKGAEADRIRAQLLKDAEIAQKITAKAIEYRTLAPKVLNQPIGIRVFARVDGHEIELARTKPQ